MQPPALLARFLAPLRLPRRTVRLRLTVLYGVLVLLSTAGLLAVINLAAGPHRATRYLPHQAAAQAALAHASDSHRLFIVSLIALGIMAVASAMLGWLVAGWILRPLRAM